MAAQMYRRAHVWSIVIELLVTYTVYVCHGTYITKIFSILCLKPLKIKDYIFLNIKLALLALLYPKATKLSTV